MEMYISLPCGPLSHAPPFGRYPIWDAAAAASQASSATPELD